MKIIEKIVIFDLDGVITKTEIHHKTAWKISFDQKLMEFFPDSVGLDTFDLETDYHQFIDGKSRYEGIRSYLKHRLAQSSEIITIEKYEAIVESIAKDKSNRFLKLLINEGIETYPDAVSLIYYLKNNNTRLGLASSSKNAHQIIEETGLKDYFEIIITGAEVEINDLISKPAPDIFFLAMDKMNVKPNQVCIIEDSLSGVEAAVATGCLNVIAVLRGASKSKMESLKPKQIVSNLYPI